MVASTFATIFTWISSSNLVALCLFDDGAGQPRPCPTCCRPSFCPSAGQPHKSPGQACTKPPLNRIRQCNSTITGASGCFPPRNHCSLGGGGSETQLCCASLEISREDSRGPGRLFNVCYTCLTDLLSPKKTSRWASSVENICIGLSQVLYYPTLPTDSKTETN